MRHRLMHIRQSLGAFLVKIGAKMTDPRSWPNNAMDARDRAAEEATRGVRILEPLVMEDGHSRDELEQGAARSLNIFQKILRLLEGAGARTRP